MHGVFQLASYLFCYSRLHQVIFWVTYAGMFQCIDLFSFTSMSYLPHFQFLSVEDIVHKEYISSQETEYP